MHAARLAAQCNARSRCPLRARAGPVARHACTQSEPLDTAFVLRAEPAAAVRHTRFGCKAYMAAPGTAPWPWGCSILKMTFWSTEKKSFSRFLKICTPLRLVVSYWLSTSVVRLTNFGDFRDKKQRFCSAAYNDGSIVLNCWKVRDFNFSTWKFGNSTPLTRLGLFLGILQPQSSFNYPHNFSSLPLLLFLLLEIAQINFW